MPPEKMISIYFSAPAEKLCEAVVRETEGNEGLFQGDNLICPPDFYSANSGAALVFDKAHSALYAFSSAMAKLRPVDCLKY